tara:strand:- start:420 stop:1661 length:1242 start_codon:yes stop_codon:yes gene_type:complete
MKLTTKTGLSFISLSAIFFLLGSVFMYYAVRVILADDLSSRLYQMQSDFIENSLNEIDIRSLSNKNIFIEKLDSKIKPIITDTVLIEGDNYVLYRKINFPHKHNNQNYSVEILQSQKQTDLLIWRIVILNVALAMTFFLIIFFLNHLSVKRGLRIFYKTVSKLENYQTSKPESISFENSEIDELNKLTEIFEKMSLKISSDFNEQKEYTENVSHEIQTPLAIISSKADELLQSENLEKDEMEKLEIIMNTTSRLARINQALILLTKIENKFYAEKSILNIKKIIQEKVDFYSYLIKEKGISVKIDINDEYQLSMNTYLADTLFLNLIKNAIMHNINGGTVEITYNSKLLSIKNTGPKLDFDDNIFKRFVRSTNKESLGIGLSIVKRICDFYNMKISYSYKSHHEFKLDIKNEG